MKKIVLTLILIAQAAATAFAAGDWKGKVLDEKGEAVQFANVVLLSKADSTVIGAATTKEDGSYEIVTTRKDAILMVAIVGYNTVYVAPEDGQTISLTPDVQMLGAATVSVVMPKTKLTGEGLQTSVRGSVLEDAGTANDVLARTPGLIKGQNGLEVIGKGTPLIYINGHKVTDAGELDRLQSNEIQSIEVINNPGAQYDATITSVVRIRTIRRQGDGFGFTLSAADAQSLNSPSILSSSCDLMPENDPSVNLNMNYRKGNVDIFAGTGLMKFTSRQESHLYQRSLGQTEYVQDGDLCNEYMQKTYSLNGGMNWQISATQSAGFKADYSRNYNVHSYQALVESVYKDGTQIDDLSAVGRTNNLGGNTFNVSTNAYYNALFGRLGVDFNFDSFNQRDASESKTEEASKMTTPASIQSETGTQNSLYAAKLVFSYPIWQGQLQVGTEDTFSRIEDDYKVSGTTIPASSASVGENNIAGFASYSFYHQKVGQVSAGLRYEHVGYEYIDQMNGANSFSRQYDNFFPTVNYANAFGPVQAMANFSMKTLRPNFNMLSDAIRYNSRYVLQSGNAALQPQTMLTGGATVVYKYLVFGASYSRIDDMIASWSSRYNDEGVVLVKPRNLDSPFRQLSVYANATPTIGIWSLNYTAGMQKQWLSITTPDPYDATKERTAEFSKKPLFFAQAFNTLKFKKAWQAELGAEWHSKGFTQNLELTNNYLDLTAAVQKAFLPDGSLIVRLEGKDLAGLGRYNIKTDFGGHIVAQDNLMDTRRITLSIRYKFNTTASKYKGTGAGQDTRGRMK